MENTIKLGEAFIRRGATVAKVIDQYGEERVIYRQKGMKDLRIKNKGSTKVLELNRIASCIIANRIREARLAAGLSMQELGEQAGFPGTQKERIYEIEKNVRKAGVRFGTLYAIASVLKMNACDLMPTTDEVLALWASEGWGG